MQDPKRDDKRDAFLQRHGWGDAERNLLAADASFRTYDRLHKADGSTAIFMNAPPPQEDVRPFVNTTHLLHAYDLVAPKLLAQSVADGFLLLEDFGDARIARVLAESKSRETELYKQSMDALAVLYEKRHSQKHSGVAPYNNAEYVRELSLFTEWWAPEFLDDSLHSFTRQFEQCWKRILKEVNLAQDTLVLRDFHADNLMCCYDGRLGLLDYQDALMGDAAYDVVSLLEDARRDVSPDVVEICLEHYLQRTQQDSDEFMHRYAVLGAQRNLKIIGIFMRLCKRDGKASYLRYLPRVWAHLAADLEHPALAELAALINTTIPLAWRDVPDLKAGEAA